MAGWRRSFGDRLRATCEWTSKTAWQASYVSTATDQSLYSRSIGQPWPNMYQQGSARDASSNIW